MGIVNTIRGLRTRLHENEIEDMINLLEEERKRRGLLRDDEVLKKRGLKYVTK